MSDAAKQRDWLQTQAFYELYGTSSELSQLISVGADSRRLLQLLQAIGNADGQASPGREQRRIKLGRTLRSLSANVREEMPMVGLCLALPPVNLNDADSAEWLRKREHLRSLPDTLVDAANLLQGLRGRAKRSADAETEAKVALVDYVVSATGAPRFTMVAELICSFRGISSRDALRDALRKAWRRHLMSQQNKQLVRIASPSAPISLAKAPDRLGMDALRSGVRTKSRLAH
jgi:hypothetical protein